MLAAVAVISVIVLIVVLVVKKEKYQDPNFLGMDPVEYNNLDTQQYMAAVLPKLLRIHVYLTSDAVNLLQSSMNNILMYQTALTNVQLAAAPMIVTSVFSAGLPQGVSQEYNGYMVLQTTDRHLGFPFGKTLAYTFNDMLDVYRRAQNEGMFNPGVPAKVDFTLLQEMMLAE